MSVPHGFNPTESVLPQPGGSVPIHVMQGGNPDSQYTRKDLSILVQYGLANLKKTYNSDIVTDSKLDIIINNTEIYIGKITKKLNTILDTNNAPKFIDFLSIDTEGSEYDILSAFDFSKYTFGYICVEHNHIENNRNKK